MPAKPRLKHKTPKKVVKKKKPTTPRAVAKIPGRTYPLNVEPNKYDVRRGPDVFMLAKRKK